MVVDLIAKVLGGLAVEVAAVVVAPVGQVQLGHRDRRDLRKHFCSAYSADAAG